MYEPHRRVVEQADKLDREYEMLESMLDSLESEPPSERRVSLLLSQSKRVRRDSVLLVKTLAQLRDNLQSNEEDTR